MEIFCRVIAHYKEPVTKLKKEYWSKINDISDVQIYIDNNFQVKHALEIVAQNEVCEHVLISRDFIANGKSNHQIHFLGNTFRFIESTGEIVCLNKYIKV